MIPAAAQHRNVTYKCNGVNRLTPHYNHVTMWVLWNTFRPPLGNQVGWSVESRNTSNTNEDCVIVKRSIFVFFSSCSLCLKALNISYRDSIPYCVTLMGLDSMIHSISCTSAVLWLWSLRLRQNKGYARGPLRRGLNLFRLMFVSPILGHLVFS